jgi:hypothetical protein
MSHNLNLLEEMLLDFVDECKKAAVHDLSNPDTIAYLKDEFDTMISKLLGINVRNPFISSYYNSFVESIFSTVVEVLGVTVSNPPESIDDTKDFIKEEVNNKVDSFAERLKKRLDTKSN